jgi:signal transduction histidine kinase
MSKNIVAYNVQEELRHEMTRVVAWGTLLMSAIFTFLLLINTVFIGGASVLPRLAVALAIMCAVSVLVKIAYGRRAVYASWLLLATYGIIAATVLLMWGVNIPFGLLMLSLVIALSGVMLGSRAILSTVFIAITLLILLQFLYQYGLINPKLIDLALPPSFGDVAGHSVLFGIIALASWLSRNHMERSLQRAVNAERELQREKDSLARRLNRRTSQLRQAQIEEMQHLYRFADLGQMSAALLHELANHLAVVMLSMDDLERRHRQSQEIDRAKESINDLEVLIAHMRAHLKADGHPKKQQFNVVDIVHGDAMRRLINKGYKKNVTISVVTPKRKKDMIVRGDSAQFEQILGIVGTNAVEAYDSLIRDDKKVEVIVRQKKKNAVIEVIDDGEGIDKHDLVHLFEPRTSNKRHGMGIGLYLARQIVETHFKGTIQYKRSSGETIFSITLPLKDA